MTNWGEMRLFMQCNLVVLLLVGATEEGQVVLVDVLGDVEAVGLDQLLVIGQLILVRETE